MRKTFKPAKTQRAKEETMYSKQCGCPSCRHTAAGGLEVMEFSMESEGEFNEYEETELALELLSVSSEAELEQFLGGIFKKAWGGLKKIAKPLGSALKGIAKTALPMVGGALGSFIPIPGVGTALGSALGGAVAKALEVELGEMAQEDREFEVARRFVRIATDAARLAGQGDGSPAALRSALLSAVRSHAPQMTGRRMGNMPSGVNAQPAPYHEFEGEMSGEGEAYCGPWRQRRAARFPTLELP